MSLRIVNYLRFDTSITTSSGFSYNFFNHLLQKLSNMVIFLWTY